MPAAPALEGVLIGCLIRSPDWLDRPEVREDLFHAHPWPAAYRTLKAARDRGEVIDFVTAAATFMQAGLGASIAADACVAAEDGIADQVVPVLEQVARRREMRRQGETLVRESRLEGPQQPDVLAIVIERLQELEAGPGRSRRDVIESRALLAAYGDLLTQRAAGVVVGLPTGFGPLDDLTGGIPLGGLTILAGRPSIGKSAWAHQVAVHVAADERVLVVTPEMNRWQTMERIVAQETGIDTTRLRAGLVPRDLLSDPLRDLAGRLPSFEICDAPAPRLGDLRQLVAARCGGPRPLRLLVLDHLGYMGDPRAPGESTTSLIGRRTRGLKAIARRYDCAVLAAAQLNRGSEEGATMRRPVLADLRDSGEIEENADLVIFVHRETRADTTGELIVAKQRMGPLGSVRVGWEPASTRFTSRALR